MKSLSHALNQNLLAMLEQKANHYSLTSLPKIVRVKRRFCIGHMKFLFLEFPFYLKTNIHNDTPWNKTIDTVFLASLQFPNKTLDVPIVRKSHSMWPPV